MARVGVMCPLKKLVINYLYFLYFILKCGHARPRVRISSESRELSILNCNLVKQIMGKKKMNSIKINRSIVASLILAVLLIALIFTACRATLPPGKPNFETIWIGTWVTAPQLVEPANRPPAPGLSHNTLRQVIHVSLGGDLLRARFSNEFGTDPVTLKAVNIAASAGGSAVDPNTGQTLKFGAKPEVTIQPGQTAVSDPFPFDLKPLSNVAITIYFGDTSADVTGHPGSRTTSYIVPGDAVSAVDMPDAVHTDHWYIIAGIDVTASESAAAVVVLGNSITDGRGSGTNKQNRWPDELARLLQENSCTRHVAVLNQGIGGNCVLRNCLGPAALARFERDILGQAGVHWLVILEGINDIGQAQGAEGSAAVARDLIAAYERMIDRAHAKGIRVYGATLLPFGGSFYYTAEHEAAWKTVNEWIRSSGRFDAVIDIEAALRDPADPLRLLPAADTGDHLHPNETGHRMMAEAVDLTLFKIEKDCP
jgi:lysophospholipase L1-like esterase